MKEALELWFKQARTLNSTVSHNIFLLKANDAGDRLKEEKSLG
jgi:hypothetical protein